MSTQPFQGILIYGASTTYGGIQVLVVRFAEYLRAKGIPFAVLTTPGSRLSSELQWADQVAIEDIEKGGMHVSHVFVPHVTPLRLNLPWGALGNAKVLFWAVHPVEVFFGLVPYGDRVLSIFGQRAKHLVLLMFRSHCNRLRSLMSFLRAKRAIISMDGATRRGFAQYYGKEFLDLPIVPLPVPLGEPSSQHSREVGVLSVGYLGRMDRFKYSAVKPLLLGLRKVVGKRVALRLVLVSEGPYLERVVELCSKLTIEVVNHGFMPNVAARKLLAENADIAVCMGTAALDVAATGCPTIIIDPCEKAALLPVPRYRFVHQIVDATLGEYRDSAGYLPGLYSVADVLRLLKSDDTLGEKGRAYVRDVHSPALVFDLLIKRIAASNLTCSDIEPRAREVSSSYRLITERIQRVGRLLIRPRLGRISVC